jgi:hypothetical protein
VSAAGQIIDVKMIKRGKSNQKALTDILMDTY